MAKKSDREMRAFHARQAARNKLAVPADSIIVTKKTFKPTLPEDEKELMEAG